MERLKLPGPVPKGRKRNAPESEPNFYLMKPLAFPADGSDATGKTYSPPSSLPSVSSIASSTETTGVSFLGQAPQMTALELLQQRRFQNALGVAPGMNGLLATPQSNQLTEAQLVQFVRPLLRQQAGQQQQHAKELEAQLSLQDQIKIMRARLVAQILAAQT
jgi:hypothetical protein